MLPRALPGTPYRLLRKLGEGGMGEVFEAEHEGLARRVALKTLGVGLAHDPDAADRMRLEAQALAKLSHPGIVSVFDVGRSADGLAFVAMELVEGETLYARARRERLPLREALRVVRSVAEALHAAHVAGFIHRDVKPSNILLARTGAVKLLDFGITKLTRADVGVAPLQQPTAEGVPIGTPHYFAPEQALGDRVDARADVYACGATLWLLLTGTRLFADAADFPSLVLAHCTRPAPPPSACGMVAPAALAGRVDAVVLRALEKRAERRQPSAEVLASELRELEAALAEPALAAEASGPPGPASRALAELSPGARGGALPLFVWVLVVSVGSALLALATILVLQRLGGGR